MKPTTSSEQFPPVRTAPFAPWPFFDQDEIAAATAPLRSGKINYWTGGEGRAFEREFAEYTGCGHAIAVANGTVALELALHSLGIGPGDEVIVPCRTFIASASAVIMRGARPVVADVDPLSQNLTAETVLPRLTPRTRAIIAVHLAGWPCHMDPIMELAGRHGLKVIEDCAQSHGATYNGRRVGSLGDAAAFSFCQDKIMTTGGEGGMLCTSDPLLWEKAWAFKDHGKSYDAVYHREHPPGFRWLHDSFGTNWRLTEMQSAIGRVQLKKLPEWVAKRRAHAEILNQALGRFPALRLTIPPEEIGHSYYKYYVFLRPELLAPGWNRDRIMEAVNAQGIPCFSGSCSEIHLEKAFVQAGLQPSEPFPVARELGATSLMFQLHPTLDRRDMEDICRAMGRVLSVATSGARG